MRSIGSIRKVCLITCYGVLCYVTLRYVTLCLGICSIFSRQGHPRRCWNTRIRSIGSTKRVWLITFYVCYVILRYISLYICYVMKWWCTSGVAYSVCSLANVQHHRLVQGNLCCCRGVTVMDQWHYSDVTLRNGDKKNDKQGKATLNNAAYEGVRTSHCVASMPTAWRKASTAHTHTYTRTRAHTRTQTRPCRKRVGVMF
jgi:hypothetical protein